MEHIDGRPRRKYFVRCGDLILPKIVFILTSKECDAGDFIEISQKIGVIILGFPLEFIPHSMRGGNDGE